MTADHDFTIRLVPHPTDDMTHVRCRLFHDKRDKTLYGVLELCKFASGLMLVPMGKGLYWPVCPMPRWSEKKAKQMFDGIQDGILRHTGPEYARFCNYLRQVQREAADPFFQTQVQ